MYQIEVSFYEDLCREGTQGEQTSNALACKAASLVCRDTLAVSDKSLDILILLQRSTSSLWSWHML